MKNTIKVLSIDGGGIRGVIPAMLLAEIERRTGKPVADLFDLIAGTSTGGILALCLTVPGPGGQPRYSAGQVVELYEREGRRIFSRSFWHSVAALGNLKEEKFACAGIQSVLAEYFGDARLRDAVTNVLVPSYDIERRSPFFFKSSAARQHPDYDFHMRDVARAASAAPTYFEPMKIPAANAISKDSTSDYYALIDGGVFANNPGACALVEAATYRPAADDYLVVSLGTGALTRSLPYQEAKNWGVAQWAKPLLDVVFDGVASTVDYQLKQLLPDAGGSRSYYRFQATLDEKHQCLDNATSENITALKGIASSLVEEKSDEIETLCDALLTSCKHPHS